MSPKAGKPNIDEKPVNIVWQKIERRISSANKQNRAEMKDFLLLFESLQRSSRGPVLTEGVSCFLIITPFCHLLDNANKASLLLPSKCDTKIRFCTGVFPLQHESPRSLLSLLDNRGCPLAVSDHITPYEISLEALSSTTGCLSEN